VARERKSRASIMARQGLDVIEKIDRFIEKPEAAEAGDVQNRDEKKRGHSRLE
jgi:hypothetical protein